MRLQKTRIFSTSIFFALTFVSVSFSAPPALADNPPKTPAYSYASAQMQREQQRQRKYFEGLAKNEVDSAHAAASRLQAQAALKQLPRYIPVEGGYQPFSSGRPTAPTTAASPSTATSSSSSASPLPQREPVYVSQDLEYARMKEDMAREKAEYLRKVAAQKEAGLQQSLDNMQSQMKESHVPGAAVARPEGSNLFVRYYGSSPSAAPYEVHQAAARIVPHQ